MSSTGSLALVLAALLVAPALSSCSVVRGGEPEGSVFAIKPGECFLAPKDVKAQISSLDEVRCSEPHDQEAFAVVAFTNPDPDVDSDIFPGDDVLNDFALGACAQEFTDYVGVDYLDSTLFYTYLLPSPRSWQEKDRNVVCFVIDSGRPMEGSVAGTKL